MRHNRGELLEREVQKKRLTIPQIEKRLKDALGKDALFRIKDACYPADTLMIWVKVRKVTMNNLNLLQFDKQFKIESITTEIPAPDMVVIYINFKHFRK